MALFNCSLGDSLSPGQTVLVQYVHVGKWLSSKSSSFIFNVVPQFVKSTCTLHACCCCCCLTSSSTIQFLSSNTATIISKFITLMWELFCKSSKLWSSLEERNLEARGKVSDDSPREWYFKKGFTESCCLRIKRVSRILFRSIKRCLQPVRVWRLYLLSQPAQARHRIGRIRSLVMRKLHVWGGELKN